MDWTQILLWLTPFVVWIVTALVKWAKPLIPGWLLVGVIVPVISILLTVVAGIFIPQDKPILQFVIGLLAVFLSQLKIQLGSEKRAEDKASVDKIG